MFLLVCVAITALATTTDGQLLQGPYYLQRGNKLLSTAQSKGWIISFDIKPVGKIQGWSNILHLTKGHDLTIYGDRTPAIWFHPDSTRLHIYCSINGIMSNCYNGNTDLKMNEYTHVEIMQTTTNSGLWRLFIYVGGEKVVEETNLDPRELTALDLYMSNPWYPAAMAYIKNFFYENLKNEKSQTKDWILQSSSVCYGAKGNQFGEFHASQNGILTAIKLEHLNGYVTCAVVKAPRGSNWGCPLYPKCIYTLVTDSQNTVMFPELEQSEVSKWSNTKLLLPGYHGNSASVVFVNFNHPSFVAKGQELRIWYWEDLVDHTEADNGGKHCVKVYAKFKN